MIKRELDLLPDPSKLFIGGFGQGSVVSIASFLDIHGVSDLGGIISFNGMQGLNSTSFDFSEKRNTEVMISLGLNDSSVPPKVGNSLQTYF